MTAFEILMVTLTAMTLLVTLISAIKKEQKTAAYSQYAAVFSGLSPNQKVTAPGGIQLPAFIIPAACGDVNMKMEDELHGYFAIQIELSDRSIFTNSIPLFFSFETRLSVVSELKKRTFPPFFRSSANFMPCSVK